MREIRNYDNISAQKESRLVEGYGIVFESESVDLGGFTEIISRNAISEDTIKSSDILFLLDHNRERGVLARSKNGSGSLAVEIDEHGVKYSFDAPQTALGDEILEGLRRGDINKCSFAFTVAEDSWTKREDGTILRTIEKIEQIFDISIVYNPAYESTEVINKRGLEELEEQKSEDEESTDEVKDPETEEVEEKSADSCEETEEQKSEDEEQTEDTEEKSDDNTAEEVEDKSDDEDKEAEADDENADESKEERHNLYNKSNTITTNISMNKNKFSLVDAIRDIVNHRNLDEVTLNVIKEGRSAADKSGLNVTGQIVLPVEMRADGDEAPAATVVANGVMATEATMGKEAVPTDTWDIMGALRDRLVLAQAGAQFITAQGDISIPVYDGSSVYWESEIGAAQDGAGNFSSVKLSPKRMTAFVDISKQLLNQTSASVENMLREDLINAIGEKLQKTILGNGAGSATEPAGLFNNITADSAAFAYGDAVDMEAALEAGNVYGDFSYVVSPAAKAVLRQTNVDKGSGRFVYENNEVLGINAYSTNGVVSKGVILGDFRQLVIANFGALDVTVDEISRAHYGQIRLVVNFYVDYAAKRPNAFVKRILK